ncbi:MAG: peptidylprolyl isomerase [Alphaproteobacteria bacterium]|nr:peptidylprolyl isomerase [Alphaproteobacteria bacterium]
MNRPPFRLGEIVRLLLLAVLLAGPGGYAEGQETKAEPENTKAAKAAKAQKAAKAEKSRTGDPVVARLDGKPIYRSEIELQAEGLPKQYRRLPFENVFPVLLNQVIDRKLIAAEVSRQGLDNDPEVEKRMAAIRERVIHEVYLSRRVQIEVTETALRKRYERQVKESPAVKEARARHILVKTEEEAIAVIAELENGAEFAATATAKSIGPSAARGGDLGYFKREQMVPPFAEAAFALKPGEMTKKPVKTQFGWHIILTEDIREIKPPSFEQKRDQLHTDMSREVVRAEMFRLRKSTKIERFNPDGSPVVEPKATPAEKDVEPKPNPTRIMP